MIVNRIDIIVSGAQGVGKTRLCKAIKAIAEAITPEAEFQVFSTNENVVDLIPLSRIHREE